MTPQSRPDSSSEFDDLLRQLEQGDERAKERLIELAQERLRIRVRQMLSRFPAVHRFEDTSDVLQEILIKLHQNLSRLKPRDSKHFLSLAALSIRRTLLNLAQSVRRLPKYETDLGVDYDEIALTLDQIAEIDYDSERLERWTEIHKYIDGLPEARKVLFDLLFYLGMTRENAAEQLGIPYDTLKKRWIRARQAFGEHFGKDPFLKDDSGPKS